MPAPALQASHVRDEGFGADARFRALLAEHAGRPVGYALFYRSLRLPSTARAVCTCRTSTSCPRRAARGSGRALMAAVARACQADGGCYVFWNARPRNRAALAFYRRIGARKEPTVTLSLQPDALDGLAATTSTAL